MIAIQVIQLETPPVADLPVRLRRQWQKGNMAFGAHYWADRYLKGHFTRRAKQKYNHKQRSRRWRERKRRLARLGIAVNGGRTDIVFKGLARERLLNLHDFRIFPTRATLRMNSPSYISQRSRKGRPAYGLEITAVTGDEQRDMDQKTQAHGDREISKVQYRRRRRFKGR